MRAINRKSAIGSDGFLARADLSATILELLRKAWSLVLEDGNCTPVHGEDEIAGFLYNKMWIAKQKLGIKTGPPYIDNEPAERRANAILPSGFIDLKLIFGFDRDEYVGIECKRLNDDNNTLAKYYVDHGILRFVDGRYCPGHRLVMMAAFIVDNKIQHCAARLGDQIEKSKPSIQLKKEFRIDTSFGWKSNLYRSDHGSTAGHKDFVLLHVFLAFDPAMN